MGQHMYSMSEHLSYCGKASYDNIVNICLSTMSHASEGQQLQLPWPSKMATSLPPQERNGGGHRKAASATCMSITYRDTVGPDQV